MRQIQKLKFLDILKNKNSDRLLQYLKIKTHGKNRKVITKAKHYITISGHI